jgi:hypothetical protein
MGSRVCAIGHLPLLIGSLAREESGPAIKAGAYIQISVRFKECLQILLYCIYYWI